MDSGFLAIRATYKGLVAEKRYYVYKRKVGGLNNYGLDVTPIKSAIGSNRVYSPRIITANAYSTLDNGITKNAYSGADISVDVRVGEDEWYNDLDIATGSSSVTFKIERTSELTPSIEASSPYNLIKLPMNTSAVRMRLVSGTTILDQQEVVILTASSTENAEEAILTQEKIFNTLTRNGQVQGIYLDGGQLYINASYIGSGAIDIGYLDNNQTWHETFYANSENGTVRINANSLKIQGTNVVDAAVAQAVPQAALEAEDSILNSVDSQDKIFDALIGGDNQQGIILDNGKLYLSSTYIRTGTLKVGGVNNTNGTIEMRNASNTVIGGINNTEIFHKHTNNDKVSMNSGGLYFYRNTSTEVGSINKYVSGNKYYLQVYGQDSVDITSKGEVMIRTEDSNNVYPGITVKKSTTAPVEISNGANEYWVELPTSIDVDGKVVSYASVRLVGGIIYNR